MRKSLKTAALAGVLALASLSTACYGPFHATRNLHKWNGQVSENKWVVEIVYLIPGFIAYPLFVMGDSLIFNSIQFWGGDNPIELSADAATPVPALVGLEEQVAYLPAR